MVKENKKKQYQKILNWEEDSGSYYGDDNLEIVSFDVSDEKSEPKDTTTLKKDNFPLLLIDKSSQLRTKGENVRDRFLRSLKKREWSKKITLDKYKGFTSPDQVLEEMWTGFKNKPKRYIGGRHISWISQQDFPQRATPLPRSLWIDLGQKLSYSYIQSNLELEYKDYVEEIEEIEREKFKYTNNRQENKKNEASVRLNTARRLETTTELDQIERDLDNDLVPFIEKTNQDHFLSKENRSFPWISYSTDGLIPFNFNNNYIGGGEDSFSHKDPWEKLEIIALYKLSPNNFESLCPLPLSISSSTLDLLQYNYKQILMSAIVATEKFVNIRRTRLTQDELLVLGFINEPLHIPSGLIPVKQQYTFPFTPRLHELTEREFELWKEPEVFFIRKSPDPFKNPL